MSAAETSDAARPARFGLAAKLFAILILLGAVAVLITGVLGYVRARDALEQTIFNQLTATRETKAHQVEIYFRSIRAEMRLLAHSKMVVDAMRSFHGAVDETVPLMYIEGPMDQIRACDAVDPADMKLTVYPDADHLGPIDQTYDLSSGNDIYAWMLGISHP